MIKRLLTCLFSLLFITAGAQPLSTESKISVLTLGPDQNELYSAFGHSAIRVYDPIQGIDVVFNYGVFNFNQPNFYFNFARGFLYYDLGVHGYPNYRNAYIYYNRYIHEQTLNLSHAQANRLYDYLLWNNQPENIQYRYDYFYNNCATKIRDVLVTVFADSVQFDLSYITPKETIRDLTDRYLQMQPWGDLGIDICLGLPMDKVATPWEYMFLPDYIESSFDRAKIQQGDSLVPLVLEKNIVYESIDEDPPKGLPHPIMIFSIVAALLIVVSILDIKRKKLTLWVDAILLSLLGIMGTLLFLLWFFTDHNAAAYNFNLLWAFPLHLIVVFLLNKKYSWLKFYFLINGVLLLLALCSHWILPQPINASLFPLLIGIATRWFTEYKLRS
jgi:hypothetical protein